MRAVLNCQQADPGLHRCPVEILDKPDDPAASLKIADGLVRVRLLEARGARPVDAFLSVPADFIPWCKLCLAKPAQGDGYCSKACADASMSAALEESLAAEGRMRDAMTSARETLDNSTATSAEKSDAQEKAKNAFAEAVQAEGALLNAEEAAHPEMTRDQVTDKVDAEIRPPKEQIPLASLVPPEPRPRKKR